MAKPLIGILSTLLAAAAAAWAHGQPAQPAPAGKSIVEAECVVCHGHDGKGAAPGIPHLARQRERYLTKTFEEFREASRVHAALQSLVTGLSADTTSALARHYAALPPIPATKTKIFDPYATGAELAAACTNCHGSEGNSRTPGIPSLAGQPAKYLYDAAQEHMAGTRNAAPIAPALGALTRLDLESLALYYASQTPISYTAPSTADARKGRALSTVCSGCHGAQGVSLDTDTPSLAGQDARYLEDTIRRYRAGERRSHAMWRTVEKLTDQDIDDIAAFYSGQKARPAEQGRVLVHQTIAKCDRCHGPVDNNPALAIPVIAGQDKDYLAMAIRAYRDGKRGSSVMHYMSVPYSNAIIESIASHYANE